MLLRLCLLVYVAFALLVQGVGLAHSHAPMGDLESRAYFCVGAGDETPAPAERDRATHNCALCASCGSADSVLATVVRDYVLIGDVVACRVASIADSRPEALVSCWRTPPSRAPPSHS